MVPADAPGTSRAPSSPREEPAWLERVRRAARLDLLAGTPPSNLRWALATGASVAFSLGLCALAVHVATAEFPTTRHFSHFRFADYGTLTVVGVLVAAAGWAGVVRLSSAARWLFFRLAVVVTLVLWLPDAWLFLRGESTDGVATLMVMHLLIALVTYNMLVRLAPGGTPPARAEGSLDEPSPSLRLSEVAVRRIWSTMGLVVALDLALGVVVIVSVPFRRSAAILPSRGTWIYAAHGAVGIALGVGAVAILVLSTMAGRIGRIGAVMGAAGVGLGLVGGLCSTFQSTRLLGMAVMLVGVVLAGVGYLAPSLEALAKAEVAKAEASRAAISHARDGARLPVHADQGVDETSEGISSNGHGAAPRAG